MDRDEAGEPQPGRPGLHPDPKAETFAAGGLEALGHEPTERREGNDGVRVGQELRVDARLTDDRVRVDPELGEGGPNPGEVPDLDGRDAQSGSSTSIQRLSAVCGAPSWRAAIVSLIDPVSPI